MQCDSFVCYPNDSNRYSGENVDSGVFHVAGTIPFNIEHLFVLYPKTDTYTLQETSEYLRTTYFSLLNNICFVYLVVELYQHYLLDTM